MGRTLNQVSYQGTAEVGLLIDLRKYICTIVQLRIIAEQAVVLIFKDNGFHYVCRHQGKVFTFLSDVLYASYIPLNQQVTSTTLSSLRS